MREGDEVEQTWSAWKEFKYEVAMFKDALLYKENFNGARNVCGGAVLALMGYDMVLQGELLKQEAQ